MKLFPSTSMTPEFNDLKGQKGFKRLINATRYSLNGLRTAWRDEAAFRQECVLAAVLCLVALALPVGFFEKSMLVAVTGFVLVVELLNSGIEAVVDRIGPELHPLSGKAKDAGSAAVLVALVCAGLVWTGVLVDLFT